ncbi:hypothetical protein CDAR_514071 [Caerostris darwini]|uniref:C2H2-type domain-containing protein n=1 Tax=Caerostris darwini TaxID=1538125 RepID=A0AAV4QZ25_9ARAC|nr:hypothetical protein CDAR_514071 [Caerostris darwini]
MEIRNCQFCNAYVTNFEIHCCKNFWKQHRGIYATIPRNSYGNLAEDIDLRTPQQMHYEARRSTTQQTNISRQQRILSNVHQPINCNETAAAEIVSQYGVTNQYRYNPQTSYFLFPAMHHHLQKFQYSNSSMPIADPRFLPGFYRTFDQMNATMNPKARPCNASSQMMFSKIPHTKEMPSHFSSVCRNFGESDSALTNWISQCSERSLEIPILAMQNEQYNPMNPIPQTHSIHQTGSFPSFPPIPFDIHSKHSSTSRKSLCRNREDGIFNLCRTEIPSYFTDHVSFPSTSQISVQNKKSHAAKICAVKLNEGKNNSKNKQFTGSNYGIADSVFYASSSIQTQHHGIINSSTEPRAGEYSSPVTYSSGTYNARNISTSTTAKESSVDCKELSLDKRLSGNSSVFNTHLDTLVKKPRGELYTCSKCLKYFFRKDYLESHERCHDAERPYVCHYCDITFTQASHMRQHIRIHTGEKPYECMHCGKCFALNSNLESHVRNIHTDETPSSNVTCLNTLKKR